MQGPGISGPIDDYEITDRRWKSGMPMELEQREAARFALMSFNEYQELPGTRQVALLWGETNSKCDVIAHYRAMTRFDAVSMDLSKRFPKT